MASTVLPNGIIIPEKYSRDWYNDLYHNWQELDNLLGGGTPKDGTLTIQKNGDTVGTFSANQATDKTIDITVPTKTSDLTNDSDFVQSSDLATVATSGSYNDLTDTPTIPTVNNATLTIQKNGTNVQTFTANSSTDKTANITVPTKTSDLTNDSGFITSDNTKIPLAGSNQISGSLIPATTNAYDLGGSSYQWNNAYIKSLTINGVACGDILTHNVSEFVNVTGNQTIGGVKTFSNEVTMFGRDINLMSRLHYGKNSNPSTTAWHYLFFRGNTAAEGYTDSWYSGFLEQLVNNNGTSRGRWLIRDTSENSVCLELSVNGSDKQVRPQENNAVELGTSTNKWKSINGINPGALSLPGDTYIEIDTTNYAWGSSFTFTPNYDGHCFLSIAAGNYYTRTISLKTGRGEYYFSNQNNIFRFTFPVYKGKLVTILTASSGTESVIPTIRLFPCQGNV